MNLNISVIIPVYNAEKFLSNAVNSALQFDFVKEVILIEDGSIDNSLKICKKFADNSRIKLFQHEKGINKGAGASRNVGLRNAQYDFISFLDADDFYLPNRFDAEFKVFQNQADADGVYGALGVHFYEEEVKNIFMQKFGIANAIVADNYLTTVKEDIDPKKLFQHLCGYDKTKGVFHLDTLTLKKTSLEKYNFCFNESLRLHQDSDFMLRLAYYFQLYSGDIGVPVAKRGIHLSNRITSIKNNTTIYYRNRSKLYRSLYNWSKKHKIPKKYISFFRYKFLVFYIQSIFPMENIKLIINKFFGRKDLFASIFQKRK
jgi:glycosyltransferase involved in cell wall biosynthesis